MRRREHSDRRARVALGVNTRPLALAFALAFALAAVAAPAGATPSAKLTYVRGPGAEACPDESELRRAVAARLGYDPFFPTAPQAIVAQIHARARPDGRRGYRGDVQIVNEHGIVRGERALETKSEDCAEMVRALALGISIAVDDLDVIVSRRTRLTRRRQPRRAYRRRRSGNPGATPQRRRRAPTPPRVPRRSSSRHSQAYAEVWGSRPRSRRA